MSTKAGEVQSNEYVLAFVNAVGDVDSLELNDVCKFGVPLATRLATYVVDTHSGNVLTTTSHCGYLASAFQMAAQCHPSQFEFYWRREKATIFERAIERIEFDTVSGLWSANGFNCLADDTDALLNAAVDIREWSKTVGSVLITTGGHPLDQALVTTPTLYEYAVRKFRNHGFVIRSVGLQNISVLSPDDLTQEAPKNLASIKKNAHL